MPNSTQLVMLWESELRDMSDILILLLVNLEETLISTDPELAI